MNGYLVTIPEDKYERLCRRREAVRQTMALLEEFRTWLVTEKGTEDLGTGLRLCTTAELWEWMQRCYDPLGAYMPMSLAETAAKRVLGREAAEAAKREAEQLKHYHIDPWEGR